MKTFAGTLALCAAALAADGAFLSKHEFYPHYRQAPVNEQAEEKIDKNLNHLVAGGSAQDVEKYVVALGNTQADMGAFANRDLMNRLESMRKSICADQGFRREEEMSDCESFMGVACSLEGSGNAKTVSDEACHQFFMEEKDTASASASENVEAAAEVAVVAQEDNATNATEGGEGLFGAKIGRKLAEQGYNEYEGGRLVEHKNLHTHTEDWLGERDGRDFVEICKEFPNNQWCKMHVQRPRKPSPRKEVPPPPPVYDPPPPPPPPPPAPAPPPASEEESAEVEVTAKAGEPAEEKEEEPAEEKDDEEAEEDDSAGGAQKSKKRNKKPLWERGKSGAKATGISVTAVFLSLLLASAAGF